MKEYECPAVLENLRPVLAVAAEELIASGTETPLRQRFFVVLEELFNNAAIHAYKGQPSAGPVRLRIKAAQDYVELTVMDQGPAFDPTAYDDSERLRRLESFQPGGAGIFLVKTLSSSVAYRRDDGWNAVTAVLELPPGEA